MVAGELRRITLTGPIETQALAFSTGLDLSRLPKGQGPAPTVPLAAELLRRGYEVHIVTLDKDVDENTSFTFGLLTITFCPLRTVPRHTHRARALDLFSKEISALTNAIKDSAGQIVNAHWTYEYAEAAIRSRRPMVATMHDLGWDYFFVFRDAYRALRLLMKYRAMLRVPALTAVAPFMAKKAWQYGYFKSVDIIPNPIEIAQLRAKDCRIPIVATIGNEGRIKNVAASVEAFQQVRAVFENAELHLCGPGLDESSPFGAIGNGVVCRGNVPHPELMSFLEHKVHVLVHPSRIEACPVILGEAKMRGVPVVAGKSAGGVPFVVGGRGGTLVDIENPQEIAEATIEILTDRDRYASLQQEGHDDAVARFSIEKVTSDYVRVYERVYQTAVS